MKILHIVAFLLLLIGGINWGLVGLGGFLGANWNIVGMLRAWPMVEWAVYVLVGLSAVWIGITHKKDCKACMAK